MNKILQYLKEHGECPITDISKATNISIADVHHHLSELASKNQVKMCDSIKIVKGEEIKAVICRIAGTR